MLCGDCLDAEDLPVTFICSLPKGHEGPHEARGTIAWLRPVETPPWLEDNPPIDDHPRCEFEKDGLRCIHEEAHMSQHRAPGTPECCYKSESCWGRTSCPQQPACSS